jgi:hypothetical protein
MKPDWNSPDCPSWANYLAQDANDEWFWFEAEPQTGEVRWRIVRGRYCRAYHDDWRNTLEERVSKEVEE